MSEALTDEERGGIRESAELLAGERVLRLLDERDALDREGSAMRRDVALLEERIARDAELLRAERKGRLAGEHGRHVEAMAIHDRPCAGRGDHPYPDDDDLADAWRDGYDHGAALREALAERDAIAAELAHERALRQKAEADVTHWVDRAQTAMGERDILRWRLEGLEAK